VLAPFGSAVWEKWLYLIVITFVPGVELRGAIPVAITVYKISPLRAFVIITLANIAIIPIVFLLWDLALFLARKIKFIDIYLKKLDARAKPVIEKYGFWGLTLFVAIPLPGTGAYTGAFIAEIFDMKKRKAFFAIALGVLIAGAIITLSTLGILSFVR
jgi:uncharacterized membrane protein